MIFLSKEQILFLHNDLIKNFGGLIGVRDENLLESAINAPFQQFNNVDLFPTIQQKAARLCFGLIKNHAFVDGNKRIGVHSMLVFLSLNGIELSYTQEELYKTILAVASSELSFEKLTEWIINHQI